MLFGWFSLPEGRFPADECPLQAAEESDLSGGGNVQLPGIDGGQESSEGLCGLSEGRFGW